MDDINKFIPIPEFLDTDFSGDYITPECIGQLCGEGGCCTTECSQYCMGSQDCGESCGQSCSESCSESCGESCGEDCGESSPAASLYFSSVTETSFGVGVDGLSTTYVGGRVCDWYVGGVYKGSSNISDGVSSGGYIIISGLDAGTLYSVMCEISRPSGALLTTLYGSVRTSEQLRPDNWTWTTAELNAFSNRGSVRTLTWQRWNQFCDRIDLFRAYKGLSLMESWTRMTSSDKVLSATRFNRVRLAIGGMSSTGITDRQPGQPVLGSYFTTLSSALNSID